MRGDTVSHDRGECDEERERSNGQGEGEIERGRGREKKGRVYCSTYSHFPTAIPSITAKQQLL